MNEFDVLIPNNLNIIDDEELKKITDRLSSNMNNKFFYNPQPYKIHNSAKIYEDFEGKNLRQSFFQNCCFENANFKHAGLAGSVFIDCTIFPCEFTDTNFQSCDFRKCSFKNIELNYTRMNKSSFYKTTFTNCIFNSVSINDAIFEKCKFIDCQWTISVENTIFKNTELENVRFKSMNFEFATFDKIKAKNVKFPFPTIPFIYNGLEYFYNTADDIRVTSAKKEEGLTVQEYLLNIGDLEKFYITTQNYFPIINIYIAQKRFTEAFDAVVRGIELSIKTRSFRMLKYYCKQIKYIESITVHQRQSLYYFILNKISQCELKSFEKEALNLYLPEVKSLLFTEARDERLQILVTTNIEETEFEKLSIFMSVLDSFLKDKCTYSLELRHNSPFQGLYDLLTSPDNIGLIISGLDLIFSVTLGCISAIREHKKELKEKEKLECEKYNQKLSDNDIKIQDVYVINGGNVYINTQSISDGNIYFIK